MKKENQNQDQEKKVIITKYDFQTLCSLPNSLVNDAFDVTCTLVLKKSLNNMFC